MARLPEATMVIMAAAVSDYRVAEVASQKLRREGTRTLSLEPTTDILRELVERKGPNTVVIGFAAETEDVLANGRAKLARKGADAVVVNDVSGHETGFDSERNAGWFVTKAETVEIAEMPKSEMAARILDEAVKLREARVRIATA
jgi:phosphopantothenoylcysteine decarboxylase/phosphopantothenate--cysteine ligase